MADSAAAKAGNADPYAEKRAALGIQPVASTVKYFNLLIYGPFGVGKTYLAATAMDHPSTSPVLIIDTEGGQSTVRKRKGLEVKSVRSIADIVKLHDNLEANNCLGYKAVVIDTLTEIQKLDILEVAGQAHNKNPNQDPEVPSQREWGKSAIHIRNIVRSFRDLPCHVIFTCMDQTKEDSDGSIVSMPSLPGKLAGEIPGYVDVVGCYRAVEERGVIERRLQVQPTRRTRAKDRLGLGDGVLINPTIPAMWDAIEK